MNDYKIKVNDEAESKEAQELFFQLGYEWYGCGAVYNRIGNYTFITAYPDEMRLRMGWGGDTDKELTLPQLRDLVVLHRNDVKDATHTDQDDWKWFIASNGDAYCYQGKSVAQPEPKMWLKETLDYVDLKPIQSEPEQGLISGADVTALLKKAEQIQFRAAPSGSFKGGDWKDLSQEDHENEFTIGDLMSSRFEWRIKPRTIKLEIEIPAPFEPKVGEAFFVLYPTAVGGYSKMHITDQKRMDDYAKLGAWRTEEEIKQVVAALREIKG